MFKKFDLLYSVKKFCKEFFINFNGDEEIRIVRKDKNEMIVQFQADNSDITLYFARDAYGYYLNSNIISPVC